MGSLTNLVEGTAGVGRRYRTARGALTVAARPRNPLVTSGGQRKARPEVAATTGLTMSGESAEATETAGLIQTDGTGAGVTRGTARSRVGVMAAPGIGITRGMPGGMTLRTMIDPGMAIDQAHGMARGVMEAGTTITRIGGIAETTATTAMRAMAEESPITERTRTNLITEAAIREPRLATMFTATLAALTRRRIPRAFLMRTGHITPDTMKPETIENERVKGRWIGPANAMVLEAGTQTGRETGIGDERATCIVDGTARTSTIARTNVGIASATTESSGVRAGRKDRTRTPHRMIGHTSHKARPEAADHIVLAVAVCTDRIPHRRRHPNSGRHRQKKARSAKERRAKSQTPTQWRSTHRLFQKRQQNRKAPKAGMMSGIPTGIHHRLSDPRLARIRVKSSSVPLSPIDRPPLHCGPGPLPHHHLLLPTHHLHLRPLRQQMSRRLHLYLLDLEAISRCRIRRSLHLRRRIRSWRNTRRSGLGRKKRRVFRGKRRLGVVGWQPCRPVQLRSSQELKRDGRPSVAGL